MKINWKVRFQNKAFLLSFIGIVLSFIYTLLGLFGLVPTVSQQLIYHVILALVEILAALGIVIDPTTHGVTDSTLALSYHKSKNTEMEEHT